MGRAEVIADIEMVLTEAVGSKRAYLYFLDTISKFHKYNLNQQASLSMYTLPTYTAVAEERIWAQGFNVRIKQDARAIEILDNNAPDGVKVVYDVSDTELPEERQVNLLWRFDSAQHKDVFRGIADKDMTAVDSILQVCGQIENALAGKDVSSEESRLLSESIGYVLLKRLGFEREAESLAEQTISDELVKEATISLEDVSNISREILNGVQEYIQRGKGRGEDFPLQDAMERVQGIISLHAEVSKEEKRENVVSMVPMEAEGKTATIKTAVSEEAAVAFGRSERD